MSAQNTSTLKDGPLSPRASASLEASQARGAAIPDHWPTSPRAPGRPGPPPR